MQKFPYRTLAAKKIKAIFSLTASLMISFFFSFLYCRESHWLGMNTMTDVRFQVFTGARYMIGHTMYYLHQTNTHAVYRRLPDNPHHPSRPLSTMLHVPCPVNSLGSPLVYIYNVEHGQ